MRILVVMAFGYIRRRRANPFRCRQPAAVRQVGSALPRPARARSRRGRAAHRPALRPRALGRLLRGARARRRRAYRLETGSGTHGEQTGRMLPEIEAAVLEEQPDAVLVFGDTNSTLAGALAAGKLLVPVAHVEAGPALLRPRHARGAEPDARRPPLEPALLSHGRRRREPRRRGDHRGRPPGRRRHVRRQPAPRADRPRALGRARDGTRSSRAATSSSRSTARPTSQPEPLARIAEALAELDEPVVFPAHPRTSGRALDRRARASGRTSGPPPAGYLDFAALASQARVVLTDSGGVQKEAYWYGVPCVTLRTTTEWVETLETGWNRLVGSDPDAIVAAVREAAPTARPPAALRRRACLRENR